MSVLLRGSPAQSTHICESSVYFEVHSYIDSVPMKLLTLSLCLLLLPLLPAKPNAALLRISDSMDITYHGLWQS